MSGSFFKSTCRKSLSTTPCPSSKSQKVVKHRLSLGLISIFFLFLCPAMSSLVKYWRLRPGTWLSGVPEPRVSKERPEERQTSEWASKQLSENACVSSDLIPPLRRAHAHARTHTYTHQPHLPLSLHPPPPYQVRSFNRVRPLPAPLSPPHPGRNQTHHTFLCSQPSHKSLLPPSATFQPNRSSPVRAWDEEAGPLPPWSPSRLLGVAHGRTLPPGYGEKTFVTPVYTTDCRHQRPCFPMRWNADSIASYDCYTCLLTFFWGKVFWLFEERRRCDGDLEIRSQNLFTNWLAVAKVNCTVQTVQSLTRSHLLF